MRRSGFGCGTACSFSLANDFCTTDKSSILKQVMTKIQYDPKRMAELVNSAGKCLQTSSWKLFSETSTGLEVFLPPQLSTSSGLQMECRFKALPHSPTPEATSMFYTVVSPHKTSVLALATLQHLRPKHGLAYISNTAFMKQNTEVLWVLHNSMNMQI